MGFGFGWLGLFFKSAFTPETWNLLDYPATFPFLHSVEEPKCLWGTVTC